MDDPNPKFPTQLPKGLFSSKGFFNKNFLSVLATLSVVSKAFQTLHSSTPNCHPILIHPKVFFTLGCHLILRLPKLEIGSPVVLSGQKDESMFRVPSPAFRVPCSVFRIPYSVSRIPCSVFRVPYSVFRLPSSPPAFHYFLVYLGRLPHHRNAR
jgi:hypothetical protein